MVKNRSVEFNNVEALSYVGDIGDVQDLEYRDTGDEIEDGLFVSKMIHCLNANETAIVILEYFGYKPMEIVKIMGLKNIGSYYYWRRLLRADMKRFNELHKDK